MCEFLFELFGEEIPAFMQTKAKEDLKNSLEKALKEKGLTYEMCSTWITPRRLGAHVTGLLKQTAPQEELKRGPKVGAPLIALDGFLKANALNQKDLFEENGYFVAKVISPSKSTADELVVILNDVINGFSWPKVMRYPQSLTPWVRPVRNILAIFDTEILPLELFGLNATNKTFGHRFMAPSEITVTTFEEYKTSLHKAFVMLDIQERQDFIETSLKNLCGSLDLTFQEDRTLLEEVSGLCEWPFVRLGAIEEKFLNLPLCVLSTSMKVHQKYFTVLQKDGKVAPYFAYISNQDFKDVSYSQKGFEKVLKARLSDALFFFDQDKKISLDDVSGLKKIIFHKELGTLFQKIERIAHLVDSEKGKRAALLCKSDLLSSMVGEFPELQGKMGAIYALEQKEDIEVSQAILEHYSPMGPHDNCPKKPVSCDVALADKIDTLVGFFGIKQLPTGSKDPYGLRRCALGIIRLIRENDLTSYDLFKKLTKSCELYGFNSEVAFDVYAFILSRLEGALKGLSLNPDVIQACVGSLSKEDYPTSKAHVGSLSKRASVLGGFMNSIEGQNLQKAYTRALGIVKGEEKKEKTTFEAYLNVTDVTWQGEDEVLAQKIFDAQTKVNSFLKEQAYEKCMSVLSTLRPVMDHYFEATTIVTGDIELTQKRLRLLSTFIQCVHLLAVLSFVDKK
ncbi:MAG TPA: glycine--tRNA ligase subunit beta [Alphaproteobacteria bacterium]|nr:glycine--tRNA ligase subunit beta [Alphaproteobacteria bacterium]